MILEDRYGNPCNGEEFSVEVKRGNLYCNPERVNILYLICRAGYTDRNGKSHVTSEILRREAFSSEMMEKFLDEKDRLKAEQADIDRKTAAKMNGVLDFKLARQIKIENGWAMREADE